MTVRSRPGPAGRRDQTRTTPRFLHHSPPRPRPAAARPEVRAMSATRRRPARRLRIDTFEDRVVPTIGLGVNVDSFGVTGGAPDGNSAAVGPNDLVQITAGNPNVGA